MNKNLRNYKLLLSTRMLNHIRI